MEGSKEFGLVLSTVLERHYYTKLNGSDNSWITFDVLLGWIAWPSYLRIIQQGLCCIYVLFTHADSFTKRCSSSIEIENTYMPRYFSQYRTQG